MKLSSNAVGNSNDQNDFPHKLVLTNIQISKLCKAFANNSSANIKSSKTQLHRNRESEEFLDRLFGPFLKTGLALMKNVVKPLAKSILIP